MNNSNFRFINHDISDRIYLGFTHHPKGSCVGDIKKIDIVMHMASRASPFEFQKYPIYQNQYLKRTYGNQSIRQEK